MCTAFSAFGLSLRAGFRLPRGLPSADPRLPGVALELESAAELAARWSGPANPGAWRGRLGDGEEFTVRRGTAEDLLFHFGTGASFRLDVREARLGCAVTGAAPTSWRRFLLGRVLPNVAIAHRYEALHAAAVTGPRGVVAIAASSGGGKSTLACELVRRGWRFFADDTVVLGRAGAEVRAHPAAPFANLAVDGGADLPGAELGRFGEERWVAVKGAATAPAAVAAVVLLERAPGLPLAVEPLPASPLRLAPFMLGLPDDEGRDADRFALYADLVERAALLRLSADPAEPPQALAAALEEALAPAPVAIGGRA